MKSTNRDLTIFYFIVEFPLSSFDGRIVDPIKDNQKEKCKKRTHGNAPFLMVSDALVLAESITHLD